MENSATKFENLVASHLLKFVHFLYDTEGYQAQLFFLRDRPGREVDFLVGIKNKPWFAVEVKESAKEVSKHLNYFGERLKIPFLYQVVLEPGIYLRRKNIIIISAEYFLQGLV